MHRLFASLLFMTIAGLASAAPDAEEDAERQRRLSLLFATESRSFFCLTHYRIRSAGDPGARIDASQPMVFAPVVPGVGDLHNWLPQDEGMRAHLGAARFGEPASGEALCGGRLDTAAGLYLPRPERRGDLARLLLYLERMRGVKLDASERLLLIGWDMRDAMDSDEAARARRIDMVQGTDYGAPRRTLDALVSERRALRMRDRPLDGVQEQLRKRDYPYAYWLLNSELERRFESLSLDLLDGKTGAWDRAFEMLAVHDDAARSARVRMWRELDSFAAKMFAFAVAAGNDDMASWHANWLLRMAPPGMEFDDSEYAAFILQMAEVVREHRWPDARKLRAQLGPYRGLFLDAADASSWREAMNAAVNRYLEPELYRGANPRVFAVEFAALTKLRKAYAAAQYSEPVHALQLLPSARVPPMRTGTMTPELLAVRRAFKPAPALPALHRAVLANDRAAFDAALQAGNVDQLDYLGESPLLIAAEWNRESMIAALRAAGAKPLVAGRTLLSAAAGGQEQTVRNLLAAGADPNYIGVESQEGGVMHAALSGQVDTRAIIGMLLAAGARPAGEESWRSWVEDAARAEDLPSFLERMEQFKKAGMHLKDAGVFCALSRQEKLDAAAIEAAGRLGASVNEGGDGTNAPIFCAIEAGKLDAVKSLVAAGARLDVRNADGQSPVAAAKDQGREYIAYFLARVAAKPR